MNSEQQHSDLQNRLESVDLVAEEPMPAGWSRRNWVQRDALAFAAAAQSMIRPRIDPAGD